MFGKFKTIHFVGIGGTGMSGIAEILKDMGFMVKGSDLNRSDYTKRLEESGIEIFYSHSGENVEGADVLVVSTAIKPDNPEWREAVKKHIPVIRRGEMLAELMRMKHGIAISGTHGKTTTTSIASSVLAEGGLDPTVIIGGIVSSYGTNAKLGGSRYLLAEADESDGSFLNLSPVYTVITNIDRDHMDYYGSLEVLREKFTEFANKVPFFGASIVCLEDENVRKILPNIKKKVITYGFSPNCDIFAENIEIKKGNSRFTVFANGKELGECILNVPGKYNILNSLSVVALSLELDISFEAVQKGIKAYRGTKRRAEVIGKINGSIAITDYAHHPVEVDRTLEALKDFYKPERLICVFQPHRYTRTKELFDSFAGCFYKADKLIMLPVYPAGEKPIEGINFESLISAVQNSGHKNASISNSFEKLSELLLNEVRESDLLVFFGAGTIDGNARNFIKKYGETV
jgi:UDP-N-acetylmuramate--alanine ligase